MDSQVSSRRQIWSWALYDWANSAFTTTILVVLFPVFFHSYWASGLSEPQISLYLGSANSLASFSIMLLAPFLGALADKGGIKKPMLSLFVLLGVGATFSFTLIGQGQWLAAYIIFVIAVLSYLAANVFYDSLLVDIVSAEQFNKVSSLGYGVGYIGGGLELALCILLIQNPETFGLDKTSAVLWAIGLTALWWGLFSLPLLLFVKPAPASGNTKVAFSVLIKETFQELLGTIKHILQLKQVKWFLLAYWFYIDGVDTIVVMAVNYGKGLGFSDDVLIKAILLTQFVAFPAALAFGWLGNKLGPQKAITIGLLWYVGITIMATRMNQENDFYLLAAAVGLSQGGVQALSRALYASLIPQDRAGEFFGFYNMLGKAGTLLGPLLVGWVGMVSSPRLSILAVLVLFAAGIVALWQVKPTPASAV